MKLLCQHCTFRHSMWFVLFPFKKNPQDITWSYNLITNLYTTVVWANLITGPAQAVRLVRFWPVSQEIRSLGNSVAATEFPRK